MKQISKFLDRFMPSRLKQTVPIAPEDRLKLFSHVSDNDNCLRAVLDIMQENFSQEFAVAIDPHKSTEERLRACDGMRISYYSLNQIENERALAKQFREQEEAQRRNPA